MNTASFSLSGTIHRTNDLSDDDRSAMLTLMMRYFSGIDASLFHRDLEAKPWTILLRAADGMLAGFSTLDLMETRVGGRIVRAIYSGDTITDRHYWSTSALPRAFLRFFAQCADEHRDTSDWFWFYVCKGYRTFRFLPVFYRTFYPNPHVPTPAFEKSAMDAFGSERFGPAYHAGPGIVRVAGDYALQAGIGDITPERWRDPLVRFFAEHNPGWPTGEELVCIASLARSNLNARALRWLDAETES